MKGFARLLVLAIFTGFLFFGCGHVPEIDTTLPESGIETTETLGTLTVKINFDGETNIRALNSGERSTLTEIQKNKLENIYCHLRKASSNESSYSKNIPVENPEHTFTGIVPGIYQVYAKGDFHHSYRRRNCYHNLFEGEKQIIVNPGQNEPIAISLYLNEWQPIFLSLPEEYSGEEDEFHAELQRRGWNGTWKVWFDLSEDKTMLHGAISLGVVGEMRITFENQFCLIDDNILLSSLIEDSIIPLSECRWEPTASTSLEIGFATNYVVVPTDYPTIQAAINTAEPGTTIRLNPGTYNESIVLKPGIRIEGSISDPGSFTIKSDNKNTIFAEIGGKDHSIFEAEMSGITICNTYQGEKIYSTAAVCCDLGFDLKMSHCVIKSLGVGDCIVGNYTKMQLTNLTLIGPGKDSNVKGIVFYNTSSSNVIENIIFCYLQSAANDKIQNSVLWEVENIALPAASTFSIGDPQFLKYRAEYTPSIESSAIKNVMEHDENRNYPGAIIPQTP